MLQYKVLVLEKPVRVSQSRPVLSRKVHRSELLKVLERAAQDHRFIALLTHDGQEALESFDLSRPEKAALLSGDVRWIEARLGSLSPRLRTWLDCRLQQEIW